MIVCNIATSDISSLASMLCHTCHKQMVAPKLGLTGLHQVDPKVYGPRGSTLKGRELVAIQVEVAQFTEAGERIKDTEVIGPQRERLQRGCSAG